MQRFAVLVGGNYILDAREITSSSGYALFATSRNLSLYVRQSTARAQMKEGTASRTAEVAAATRARHCLRAVQPVFVDPFAIELTAPTWRRIVKARFVDWLIFEVLLRAMAPIGTQVILRSRYAEDLLQHALSAGVDQYVIVGAGLDSFALRRTDLESVLRVFEIDHPATQAVKRERIAKLTNKEPANLEYVGVDFESETVGHGLARSGFRRERPAFFSWLGTTPYLSNAATLATLRSISEATAAGSQIVFDYLAPVQSLSATDAQVVARLKRFTARHGEPLIGEFDPDVISGELRSAGLELIENLSGADQARRYLADRQDELVPMGASYLVHARVAPSVTKAGKLP